MHARMPPTRKITRDFYARETLTVARELIGMHLVHAEGGSSAPAG